MRGSVEPGTSQEYVTPAIGMLISRNGRLDFWGWQNARRPKTFERNSIFATFEAVSLQVCDAWLDPIWDSASSWGWGRTPKILKTHHFGDLALRFSSFFYFHYLFWSFTDWAALWLFLPCYSEMGGVEPVKGVFLLFAFLNPLTLPLFSSDIMLMMINHDVGDLPLEQTVVENQVGDSSNTKRTTNLFVKPITHLFFNTWIWRPLS